MSSQNLVSISVEQRSSTKKIKQFAEVKTDVEVELAEQQVSPPKKNSSALSVEFMNIIQREAEWKQIKIIELITKGNEVLVKPVHFRG